MWPLVHVAGNLAAQYAVDRYVAAPYMDEPFHVGQTLAYFETNDFTQWDPKITTPPGLYIVGYAAAHLLGPSLRALRSVNLLAVALVYATRLPLPSHCVHAFPLFFFFTNLYYTDPLSTALVLLGLSLGCSGRQGASALVFLSSLLFRQTNIVWAALAAGLAVVGDTSVLQLPRRVPVFLRRALRLWAFVGLGLAFALFVKLNGGIVLGDKSNHEVSLHFAQLLYFLLFTLFFSFPLAIDWSRWRLAFDLKPGYSFPLELLAIFAAVKYGTQVHPFILADNCHYTFYIWRRLCTPLDGWLLAPVYWVAYKWFASGLDLRKLSTWLYVLAVAAVLVPSPLMEPRYYIVPYLVWRVYFFRRGATNPENLWYAVVNAGTIAVFCLSKTHFMW